MAALSSGPYSEAVNAVRDLISPGVRIGKNYL